MRKSPYHVIIKGLAGWLQSFIDLSAIKFKYLSCEYYFYIELTKSFDCGFEFFTGEILEIRSVMVSIIIMWSLYSNTVIQFISCKKKTSLKNISIKLKIKIYKTIYSIRVP